MLRESTCVPGGRHPWPVLLCALGVLVPAAVAAQAPDAPSPPASPPAQAPEAASEPTGPQPSAPEPAAASAPSAPENPAPAAAPESPPPAPESPPPAPEAASRPATGAEPPPPSYGEIAVPPADDTPEGEWDPWENPAAGGHHHDGFFLRLSFGFGFGLVSTGDAAATGEAIDFSGGAAGGSFAIGATIVSSLALHVDFFFSRLLNPAVEGGRRGFDYGDPGIGGMGIGLTYYFPANLYVGASGGLASVNWERQTGEVSESEAGVGGHAIVGKEWWVDPDWGIGLAVQAAFASASDAHYDRVSAHSYHLLLSATYN